MKGATVAIGFEGKNKEKVVKYFRSMVGEISDEFKKLQLNLNKNTPISQPSGRRGGGGGAEMRRAQADIRRYQSEQSRAEKELTRQIEREAQQQANARTREFKRSSNEIISGYRRLEAESKRAATGSQSAFSSAFSGGFFGGLSGSITASFLGAISQIPSKIRGVLDEAVKISEERTNALKGLESIANFKGIDSNAAQASVQNLRLVKAGVVDITAASTGLKSLLATGFGLDQANVLLERFSDSAAFGKQSALTFNEAIERTAEGLKQGNSNLFDAAGITKNLSVILKERGFEMDDLSDKTKKQAALDALYKGILEETAAQLGDAEKLTNGYTGTVAALSTAYDNLLAATGNIITRNPDLIALIKTLTAEVQSSAISFQTSDEKAQGFNNQLEGIPDRADNAGASLNRTTSSVSELLLKVEIFGRQFDAAMTVAQIRSAELADHLKNVGRLAIQGIVGLVNYSFIIPVNAVIDSINDLINRIPAVARPFVGILGNLGNNPLPRLGEATYSSYSDIVQKDTAVTIKAGLDAKDVWAEANKEVETLRSNFTKFRGEISSPKKLPPTRTNNTAAPVSSGSGGKTEKAPKGNQSVSQRLPTSGEGFTSYRSGRMKYGTEQTIADLQTLAANWAQVSKVAISVGDISKSGGGKTSAHEGHAGGNQFDIRPFRKDGRNLPTNINDPNYDQATTRKFLQTLKATSPSSRVLFNDPQLIREGLTQYYKGHGNHLDIKLGGRARGGEDFAENLEAKRLRENKEESDQMTKAERDRQLNFISALALKMGRMPAEEVIKDLNRNAVEAAQKKPALQPSLADTAAGYGGGQGAISLPGGAIQTSLIEERKTSNDDYLDQLKEQLGTQEKIDEIIHKTTNYQQEVSLRVNDSIYQQTLDLQNAELEFDILQKQNADATYVAHRRDLAALQENIELTRQISELQDKIANAGTNDALEIEAAHLRDILDLRQRELDAVISINRSELEIAHSTEISNNQIRARVLEHLAQQKTLNESIADGIISIYDKAANKIDQLLDKAFVGKIPILGDVLKAQGRNLLTKVTGSLLDKFFPGMGDELTKTSNPVARPIVDKLDQTNDLLKQIAGNTGGIGGGLSAGSGGIGSIFGSIKKMLGFGGSSSSGGSSSGGSGGIFGSIKKFLGIGGGSSSAPALSGYTGAPFGQLTPDNFTPGRQFGGGGFSLGKILGKGGIFGDKGFGNNVGTYGGIGMGAGLLGGLVGGRVGGLISGAGSGLALGAQLGSIVPGVGTAIGAVIGAIGGGLLSLFGGDPKRKADKKENIPALQKGFADALAQLRALAADRNALFSDPDGTLAKAVELRGQIASGFGVQFQSKKYAKIARQQIASKLTEADAIISQIRNQSDEAKQAFDVDQRLETSFAKGVYMDAAFLKQFKRRNGMLAGGWTGKDTLPSMLAQGELVLNPVQQARIVAAARHDIFKDKGIPGYAGGTYVAPSFTPAQPIAANNQIVVSPQFTLVLNGDVFDEKATAFLESSDGTKTAVRVVQKGQNYKVSTK